MILCMRVRYGFMMEPAYTLHPMHGINFRYDLNWIFNLFFNARQYDLILEFIAIVIAKDCRKSIPMAVFIGNILWLDVSRILNRQMKLCVPSYFDQTTVTF